MSRRLLVSGVLSFLVTLVGSPRASAAQASFPTDVTYDTLATVGGLDETNPLLIYNQPAGIQMISETAVVFADNRAGILTRVDLVTGEGWQVDDEGRNGPGEFGGNMPFISESGGRIYAVAQSGEGSTRSLDGELLETSLYSGFHADFEIMEQPVGILDSGVLVCGFEQHADPGTMDPQVLRNGFRAYSRDGDLIWTYDSLPPSRMQWVRQPNGSLGGKNIGPNVAIRGDARHNTVVIRQWNQPWLLVLEPDGSVRGRIDFAYDVAGAFIDGDERIWVLLDVESDRKTGHYVVLDRDLNELFRTTGRGIQDAKGDNVVTFSFAPGELLLVNLLKRSSGG